MHKYINGLDLTAMNECFAASIKYIAFHCQLVVLYCQAEKIMVNEGFEKSKEAWLDMIYYVRTHELEVQSVFDLHQFFSHFGRVNYSIKELCMDEKSTPAQRQNVYDFL